MAATDTATNRTAEAVTYRPFAWGDLDAVIEQFDYTWGDPEILGSDVSRRLSSHFALHYLEPATRAEVAVSEDDGSLLGVTFSRVVGRPVLFDRVSEALADVDARLNATSLGARALAQANGLHEMERRMESNIGINARTQGELELFLVTASARGRGVGGALWRRLLASFACQGVERYYLHTDSDCDVGFYDHQGLERVAARYAADHSDGPSDDEADLFIYEGRVAR